MILTHSYITNITNLQSTFRRLTISFVVYTTPHRTISYPSKIFRFHKK